MFDSILKAGAGLDWISPVAAITREIFGESGHTFLINDSGGYTGKEVVKLLKGRGVRVWSPMVINETLAITVPKAQADRATDILLRAGIVC